MRLLSAAYTDYDCCVQVYTPHKYDMYVKVKNKLNINVQNIGILKTKQSQSVKLRKWDFQFWLKKL